MKILSNAVDSFFVGLALSIAVSIFYNIEYGRFLVRFEDGPGMAVFEPFFLFPFDLAINMSMVLALMGLRFRDTKYNIVGTLLFWVSVIFMCIIFHNAMPIKWDMKDFTFHIILGCALPTVVGATVLLFCAGVFRARARG